MNMESYYEITSELDARDVLRYLNYLGITNISGEVLKYFITDLKKLIKYDLQQKNLKGAQNDPMDWSERLHSASTFSSRLRMHTESRAPVCTRNCQRTRAPFSARNVRSEPNLPNQVEQIVPRRACSCVPVLKKSELSCQENKIPTLALNNNIIRVPARSSIKKNDPVSLYHYYNSLWEKYKPNMPGENNWADLRWTTRQKMAGCMDIPIIKKSHLKSKQKMQHK